MNDIPFYHILRKSNIKNGKSPLLLMVHGFGSNEEDLFSFSRALAKRINSNFHKRTNRIYRVWAMLGMIFLLII